uniref:NAC domain-containing protein n=1 Tax=Mesocestoides corti TaxID=53468 RepID=A0A5K3F6S5_MESCO
MSLSCVSFDPPTEITARLASNQENLLVHLTFPHVQRPSRPGPQWWTVLLPCWTRGSLPVEDPATTWSELVADDIAKVQFGKWTAIAPQQKPPNCDVWFRIFRKRICIMIILHSQSAPTQPTNHSTPLSTSGKHEVAMLSGTRLTTYYYWDSGRLGGAYDARKSRVSVVDGGVYLMLARSKEKGGATWSERDLELIQNTSVHQKLENKEQKPEDGVVSPLAGHEAGLGAGDEPSSQLITETDVKISDDCHDPQSDANTEPSPDLSIDVNVNLTAAHTDEVEAEDSQTGVVDSSELKKEVDGEEEVSVDVVYGLCESKGKDDGETEVLDYVTGPGCPNQSPEFSSTPINAAEDESTSLEHSSEQNQSVVEKATSTPRCDISSDCQYCDSVSEQVRDDFYELQARIRAMTDEQWAKVISIIFED